MTKPISYYYSSRIKPMPEDVENWLENLPAIHKVKIAKALLSQIDDSFSAPSKPVAGIIYEVN
ncbi:hypothetical protein [Pseudanabaena yagii]|jgi:hypothetical protein|uniref:Uncharacterized protein n=1 Tax=Pseudanabaena yagii GIHE-NHR1 TaxID=2722753 RepID=A0ABX1LQV5_9CYAN|nr:hypothetical protein [Pseudanabaena yagii]NMF57891.1 hypothetical protein [Pseudanabaena yagii GIHE-NHR1]